MQRTSREWDESYLAAVTPPWDIGAVQPALAAHLQGLDLADPVLDAGCGTGEVAIYLARHGHKVHGLDISPEAITRARAKASAQRVAVDFRVADARHLAGEKLHPGAVVDCGLLHILDEAGRRSYVQGLAQICRPGARVVVLAVSPEADEGWDMTAAELAGWFDTPDWQNGTLEHITVHARWAGEELRFPGYLFTTRRYWPDSSGNA